MVLLDRASIGSLTSAVRNMRSVPRSISRYVIILKTALEIARVTRGTILSELGRPRSLVVDTSKKRYKSFWWPDGHRLRKLFLPPSFFLLLFFLYFFVSISLSASTRNAKVILICDNTYYHLKKSYLCNAKSFIINRMKYVQR